MDILKDTLKISNVLGGYDLQTRLQLTNDLINQQSNDLKEVEPKPKLTVKGHKSVLNGWCLTFYKGVVSFGRDINKRHRRKYVGSLPKV